MLVIRRVMGRDGDSESRMMAAVPARRKRLALHHGHLMLVVMDPVVNNVVDPGVRANIARFELFHKWLSLISL